jgi:hypothetical protein
MAMGSSLTVSILPEQTEVGCEVYTLSGIINVGCTDRFDVSKIAIIIAIDVGQTMTPHLASAKNTARALAETFHRHPLTLVTFGADDAILVSAGSAENVIEALDSVVCAGFSSPVHCINFISSFIDSGIVVMLTNGGTPMPLKSARIHDERLHSQVKMLEACFIDFGARDALDLFSLSLELQGLYLQLSDNPIGILFDWVNRVTAKGIKLDLLCPSGIRLVEVTPFHLNVHPVKVAKHYKIYLPFIRGTGPAIAFKLSLRECESPGQPIIIVYNVYVETTLYESKYLRIKRVNGGESTKVLRISQILDRMSGDETRLKAITNGPEDVAKRCSEFSRYYRGVI